MKSYTIAISICLIVAFCVFTESASVDKSVVPSWGCGCGCSSSNGVCECECNPAGNCWKPELSGAMNPFMPLVDPNWGCGCGCSSSNGVCECECTPAGSCQN